ncbi:uncharacterized protein METZ01_LOCUS400777, partial [marine metagenome]
LSAVASRTYGLQLNSSDQGVINVPWTDTVYGNWTADSDEGTDIDVGDGDTLLFTGAVEAGGSGIATDSSVSVGDMTIGLINAGGTAGATTFYRGDGQWTVPPGTGVTGSGTLNTVARWTATGSNLGDGPIVFSDATSSANSAFGGDVTVTGNVGIGLTAAASLLTIQGTGDAIRIESTNAGAGGAQIDLLHFTASPADEDTFAVINGGGYYTGTTSVYGTQIKSIWTDVSERHSRLEFYTADTTVQKVLTLDNSKNAAFEGAITTAGSITVNTEGLLSITGGN